MDDHFVWNLAYKASNPEATSTFNTLTMTKQSTLNAFNRLNAAQTSDTQYIMVGQVSSDASTVNLQDPATPTADDQLTINGNYTGANDAVLALDTCLGTDDAPSDTMTVSGAVSGTTIIKIQPTTGASCVGAATSGYGIPVVKVAGSSPVGSFVLNGGKVTAGNYVYELVQQADRNWYLQSRALTGTLTIQKVVTAPAGAPPFSGSIPYTVTCATPDLTQNGTLAVTDNQGSASHTLQAGSQCTVAEGVLPAAPAGYQWASPAVTQPTGAIPPESGQTATITNALLALPVATLTCDPATLFDSASQVSTCKVTLNAAAPAGGLTVAITPPASNPRYTTTCATPLTVAAGTTEISCTITATVNTEPGDGEVTAALSLAAGSGYVVGTPGSAAVTVKDDDVPLATLSCTPATLTDSESQVSTCTVTLNAAAPAGGLPVTITPPASNPRYSTTCATPLTVAAGAKTASCTITAKANTEPGDGDVEAVLKLVAGQGYGLGVPASATVTVQDDDKAAGEPTPIPTLGQWSLMLLGLGIAGLAARRRRLH